MNKSNAGIASLALLSLTLASCGGDNDLEVTSGTVIRNATIVNTRDGSLSTGMTLIVAAGKIEKITADQVLTSGAAQTIDATGKFVVPGFLDMHAHVMDAVDASPTYWPLLIANGVTGVREMSGSDALIPRVRKLNADSAAGLVDAPEILMVHGGTFAGPPTTAAAAVQFVQQKKAAGADYVKVTAGNPAFVLAVLGEAKAQGLGVSGHLATAVSALDSSNAGWRMIDHLGAGWGLLLDCATNEAAIRQSALTTGFAPPFPPTFTINPRLYDAPKNAVFYQGILDTYSEIKCQTLAQAFVTNQTWQVPTLIRLRTQNFSDSQLYRADPNLIYVDKTRRALWEQLAQQYATNIPPAAAETLRQFYGLEQKVTKLLKQNGVKMVAGSDSANIAIWTIPGFSLQQEFRELAASGLSPLEVLQMTTLNGAEFLGRQTTMGTVDEGKNADLVLLDANPIADVANLAKISAVFLRGKHFSKEVLDKMKSDVAAAYEKQPLNALSTVVDPHHVD